jgi:hypothetical protein
VLVSEAWKRHKDYMPPFARNVMEELLSKGGELVMHDRQAQRNNLGYASS